MKVKFHLILGLRSKQRFQKVEAPLREVLSMIHIPNLGTIVEVDIKEIWPHEAQSFTPWLLKNAGELAKVLHIDFELSHNEHAVGNYSLDLIGKDSITGDVIIIENQLEQSDHSHLGQLLTYAAGTEAVNVVWIAPTFREEHRAALDWLNSRTDERTRFFAVEVGVIKIDGQGAAAPMFKLVAQPNNWNKTFKLGNSSVEAVSEKSARYMDFWGKFLDSISTRQPGWTNSKTPATGNWMNLKSGTSAVTYGLNFPYSPAPALRVELYLQDMNNPGKNLERYNYLLDRKDEIEEHFGEKLSWEALEDKAAKRIAFYLSDAVFDDESRWPTYIDWFIETTLRFKSTFGSHIEPLSKI